MNEYVFNNNISISNVLVQSTGLNQMRSKLLILQIFALLVIWEKKGMSMKL